MYFLPFVNICQVQSLSETFLQLRIFIAVSYKKHFISTLGEKYNIYPCIRET